MVSAASRRRTTPSASVAVMCKAFLRPLRVDHSWPGAHLRKRELRFAADLPPRHQRAHVIDAAAGDDTTLGDHGDAVGERLGFFEIVRGQHDGAAVGEQRGARWSTAPRAPARRARPWARRGTGPAAGRRSRPRIAPGASVRRRVCRRRDWRGARCPRAATFPRRSSDRRSSWRRARTSSRTLQLLGQFDVLHHHAEAAAPRDVLRRAAEQRHVARIRLR